MAVVGLSAGEPVGKRAWHALESADLVVGGRRHLETLRPSGRSIVVAGDLTPVLDAIDAEEGRVCVVASGDPGFFGLVRSLGERLGPDRLEVHPAPSSVSLAFARLGLAWDDAVVVSAHGRPLESAIACLRNARKAAVLTSPANPPEAVGRALLDGTPLDGAPPEPAHVDPRARVAVCSRLGDPDESITRCSVHALANGSWDPLSVVIILGDQAIAPRAALAWGLPESGFAHRNGMITKAEVRAVVLAKLALPPTGVVWDIGAGSGSVAIECAALAPGLRVVALERNVADARRIEANASAHGVTLDVVVGEAPGALAELPDPDRVFIGGGGIEVLDAVLARLAQQGRVVATYAALDRALQAYERLGSMVEVSISRAETLGGGVRLVANNPVLVAWGPSATHPPAVSPGDQASEGKGDQRERGSEPR